MRKTAVLLVIICIVGYFIYTKDTSNPDIQKLRAMFGAKGAASPVQSQAPGPTSPSAKSSGAAAFAVTSPAAPAPSVMRPAMGYATVADATRAATTRYPSLVVANSAFNKEFVARYNRYKQERADYFGDTAWPVRLADEVAQVVHVEAVAIPVFTPPLFVTHHFATALMMAKNAAPRTVETGDAFSLSQLDEAKAKAQREGKPLGFIMCWGQFFGKRSTTRKQGSESAFAHFYQVFRDGLVLVFVRHETELQSVPDAVKKGFSSPDEGGFAPNMAVVDATASEFIVEIPMGGGDADGRKRDEVFTTGAAKIDQWLAVHPTAISAGQ